MDFLKYLTEQLIPPIVNFKTESGRFILMHDKFTYTEESFDPETAYFTIEDIAALQKLFITINEYPDEDLPDFEDINLLKNWYLITHEKYLRQDIIYDKYGRIGFNNVNEPFNELLKIPIADVLRKILRRKLNIEVTSAPQIYLTCDYDILNKWDVWGFIDFLKEIIKSVLKFDFTRLGYNTLSYFFSRKNIKYNGYLNDKMFDFTDELKPINIAFFISKPENIQFDGKINYSDRTINSFFRNLNSKKVIFGLHTNFDTSNKPQNVKQQIDAFEKIFNKQPTYNRHHYLRFHFPEYLESLGLYGIKCDFSLYYPENTCFRAGTSSKYKAWNVKTRSPYPTEMIPITLMDGTFSDYLKCTEQEAYELILKKLNLALKYSDTIVLLWHNSSICKYGNIVNNYHPALFIKTINYLKTILISKINFR
jgi:hypothetical protein